MTWTFTEPQEGDILAGRYRLDQTLGRGGFGIVFKAHDQETQRTVALKVLHATYARKDPKAVERFRREAILSASIAYPNSVRVFDYGQTEEGIFYLVMEFLAGTSLSAALRHGGPMTERRALHILKQVLHSLMEAHQNGIVHRDIKPENIMLVPLLYDPDFVKVMDFGIAKMASGVGPQITQAGQTFGTPRYMAPEQLQGGQLSPATDLYAVGLILYEMLTGAPAVQTDTLADTISQVIFGQTPSLPPSVAASPGCHALLGRACQKDPAARFEEAQDFLLALEDVEEHLAPALEEPRQVVGPPHTADRFSASTLALDLNQHESTLAIRTEQTTDQVPPRPAPSPQTEPVNQAPADSARLWKLGCVVFAILFLLALLAGAAGLLLTLT